MITDTPEQWIAILKNKNVLLTSSNVQEKVKHSLDTLKTIKEEYVQNERNETSSNNLTNDICDFTLELIDRYENQENSRRKKTRKLYLLLSFLLVGLPSYLKIRKEEHHLHDKMNLLRQDIKKAKLDFNNRMIEKKIEQLPKILDEIKKHISDQRREELINYQLMADWKEIQKYPTQNEIVPEFVSDIKNGASFRREDPVQQINDTDDLPPPQLDEKEKLEKAKQLLNAVLIPGDEKWKPILQIAVSHALLFTSFKAVLSDFNIHASIIQWEENGLYYSIKSIPADRFSPVMLHIIRSPQTNLIEQIDVSVEGGLDIVRYNTQRVDMPLILFPDAIKERLQYSLSFNKQNQPVVKNLHSTLTPNIDLKKNFITHSP